MTDSGSMGTTRRLGHTSILVSVSRMNGSSHSRIALAENDPPKAAPKSRLKCVSGGFLRVHEIWGQWAVWEHASWKATAAAWSWADGEELRD